MPLSKESKDAIRESIDELKFKKAPVVQQIQELTERKQILIAERDDLEAQINRLQSDLTNG